jgi:hypothetical protein
VPRKGLRDLSLTVRRWRDYLSGRNAITQLGSLRTYRLGVERQPTAEKRKNPHIGAIRLRTRLMGRLDRGD